MKVYEKLNNLVPCVNVYIKNRDTGEDIKFWSHDAKKISESEHGRKFFDLEIVSYKAYGYIPLVDIEAAEPGTIPPNYYEKETEKYEIEAKKAFSRAIRNLIDGDTCKKCKHKKKTPGCISIDKNYGGEHYNCQRPGSPCFNRIVPASFFCQHWRDENA